jgi:signal transduction histidine kinase
MNDRSIEILLVEDNAADVDLVREALERGKCPVTLQVVDRGEAAMAYLRCEGKYTASSRPDFILLDLNLPGTDGREVLHFIKNSENFKSIPVVVLTSSEADMDIVNSYALGANAYVVKPIGFPEFLQAISKIEDFWHDSVEIPTQERLDRHRQARSEFSASFAENAAKLDDIRTLVVEDNDADADLILETLKNGDAPKFRSERVIRLDEARQRLRRGHVDLVLLDLSLPDSQGFDTITSLRESFPHLPIVVMTGLNDPDMGVRAVAGGVQDYVVKGQIGEALTHQVLRCAVARKKVEINQLELYAAEKETRLRAEKDTSIREEFLSIASHELKNPLTSLVMQLQLLRKLCERSNGLNSSADASQLETLLGGLDRDFARLHGLIDSLLDISRIQGGRFSLALSQFNLGEMAKEVISRFGKELENAGCPVRLFAETDVFGQWDRLRMEQVLSNLLGNAAKYAKGKPVKIRIYRDESHAVIAVQDHGPGIPAEDHERIFSRFERAVQGQQIQGLGLGLYIVRQIIRAHGGTISLLSELGEGSTFVVRLPELKEAD